MAFGNDGEYEETTDDNNSGGSRYDSFQSKHSKDSFIVEDESVHTFTEDGVISSQSRPHKGGGGDGDSTEGGVPAATSGKRKAKQLHDHALHELNQASVEELGQPPSSRLASDGADFKVESCSVDDSSHHVECAGGVHSVPSSAPKASSRRPSNAHSHGHAVHALPSFLGGFAGTPRSGGVLGSPVPKPSKKEATYSDLLALNKVRQKSFHRSKNPRVHSVDSMHVAPPVEPSPKRHASARPINNFFLNGYQNVPQQHSNGSGKNKLQQAYELVRQAKEAQQRNAAAAAAIAASSPFTALPEGKQLVEDVADLKEEMKQMLQLQMTMQHQMNNLLSHFGLAMFHPLHGYKWQTAVGEFYHKGKEVAAAVVDGASTRVAHNANDAPVHFPADRRVTIPHKAALLLGTKSQYFNLDGEEDSKGGSRTSSVREQNSVVNSSTKSAPQNANVVTTFATQSKNIFAETPHDPIVSSDNEPAAEQSEGPLLH